jgi:hypothetical protein
VSIRHAHLFCVDDVHNDATLSTRSKGETQGRTEPRDMRTFSIWARPDLTCRSEVRALSHRILIVSRRRLCKRKTRAVSERKHTPQMCPGCCFPHLLRVSAHQRLIQLCFLLLG